MYHLETKTSNKFGFEHLVQNYTNSTSLVMNYYLGNVAMLQFRFV